MAQRVAQAGAPHAAAECALCGALRLSKEQREAC
jgi:hypothetical protein